MGISDRHYYSNRGYTSGPPAQPSRLSNSPVVKWLLIINIAIFFLDMLMNRALTIYGHFSVATAMEHGQIWRFLTFQFLHASLGHIAFNMFALYMFGSFVEQWWGSRKFLVYYLLCGAAGALFYAFLFQIGVFGKDPISLDDIHIVSASYTPLVGASAGIYACLIGVAVIAPDLRVTLLFPPIPMKMRTFALGVLGIAILTILFDWHNAGGEAGHLGGAILGFFLMRNPRLLFWVKDGSFLPVHGRKKVIRNAKIIREPKIRPRTRIHFDDSAVDAILDKVNREGIQSLTAEEREILRRSAENE